MKQYFSIKNMKDPIEELCQHFSLSGTEVYMDDIVSRDLSLFQADSELNRLKTRLNKLQVKRIHCSYWAYPTSFLTRLNFHELVERFDGVDSMKSYYQDLTGHHMFKRWTDEYKLAVELGAESYVFHLIDYAPIDGMWPYSVSRQDVLIAMVYTVQTFINYLFEAELLSDNSPTIELENAGWGLEYGAQTAKDFSWIYQQLYIPVGSVKISWDINHLLHALGFDKEQNRARFFLSPEEITPEMESLQKKYSHDPALFAKKWLEYNIFDPQVVNYLGAIQLSDCKLKTVEYFTNGLFNSPYYEALLACQDWEAKEEYGVDIVLTHYDSHLVLGDGMLYPQDIISILQKIETINPKCVLLHELKNSTDMAKDLEKQISNLNQEESL